MVEREVMLHPIIKTIATIATAMAMFTIAIYALRYSLRARSKPVAVAVILVGAVALAIAVAALWGNIGGVDSTGAGKTVWP